MKLVGPCRILDTDRLMVAQEQQSLYVRLWDSALE
jgi:hypothetical protein